jgi:hypothetical protein
MGPRRDAFDILEDAYKAGTSAGRWKNKSEFATYLGVPQGTASAWLLKAKRPGLGGALRLSAKVGIDPSLWPKAKLACERAA